MMRRIPGSASPQDSSRSPSVMNPARISSALTKATQTWLHELFSQELKIDPEKLDVDIPFQDYGLDSILLAQVSRGINQKLSEPLDPSIFI